MSQNKMEELSVKDIIDRYNVIIPEIQREYVWGENEIVLKRFILDLNKSFKEDEQNINSCFTTLKGEINKIENEVDNKLEEAFNKYKSDRFINIGFLYSYKPNYYFENQTEEDLYLIDGQQRFTTLFLILFYLALKENKIEIFKSLFRFDEEKGFCCFDYRVRKLTHNFIIDLLRNLDDSDNLQNKEIENYIENKTWFLKEYNEDKTIQSMLDALKITENEISKEMTFDWLINKVTFWHFKTEVTNQGEELYITMNSRGEPLRDNENIKAQLFDSIPNNKKEWGKEWERWQDFFWKNKPVNLNNTDYMFDEFLKCIALIQICVNNQENEEDYKSNNNLKEIFIKNVKEIFDTDKIDLNKISNYFNSFENLMNNTTKIKNKYLKTDWIKLKLIDYFILLPVLYFISVKESKDLDNHCLNRIIRFFYNLSRIENISKSPQSATISAIKAIDKLLKKESQDVADLITIENISKSILTDEEGRKLLLYKNPPKGINREDLEKAFSEAEDQAHFNGQIISLLDISYENEDFRFDNFKKYYNIYLKLIDQNNIEIYNLVTLALALNKSCIRRKGKDAGCYDSLDVDNIKTTPIHNKEWFRKLWIKMDDNNIIENLKCYITERLNNLKNIENKETSGSTYYQKIWLAYEIACLKKDNDLFYENSKYGISLSLFNNKDIIYPDKNRIFVEITDFYWGNILFHRSFSGISYFKHDYPKGINEAFKLSNNSKGKSKEERIIIVQNREKDIKQKLKDYFNFDLP